MREVGGDANVNCVYDVAGDDTGIYRDGPSRLPQRHRVAIGCIVFTRGNTIRHGQLAAMAGVGDPGEEK
jgi:hypothetical protein